MEELKNRINELEERQHQLEEESNQLYIELEEAKDKLYLEMMKTKNYSMYCGKLARIKAYIGLILKESNKISIHYAFVKHNEPYRGDFHEIIDDPLDCLIGEYDCLGMTNFIEIVFDYYDEALKNYIEQWMNTHFPKAENYGEMKKLYNHHFSKK